MRRLIHLSRELLADAFFFVVIPVLIFGSVGYLLYAEYSGLHPTSKIHWNQGPQDPEATH
jgi:hypothetical protein